MSEPAPPVGFVHLRFRAETAPSALAASPPPPSANLHLEIPLSIIDSLCLKPRKYLRFVGWCVLGISGRLIDDNLREITSLDGPLEDGGIYHYVVDVDESAVVTKAVQLDVIKTRSSVTSQTSTSRQSFREIVLERDGACVWTSQAEGNAMHIIPAERVAVLKTPNPMLDANDVPARSVRATRDSFFPNNNDATFHDHALAKSADILLHYNYGAVVRKHWGKNMARLEQKEHHPKPPKPAAMSALKSRRTEEDYQLLGKKRSCHEGPGSSTAGGSMGVGGEVADSADGWEDDFMLFAWGNTRVAQERHTLAKKARTDSLQNWRSNVGSVS
ncbi:hypothetical protein C8J57DRAFT_1557458 [Mycena rebaudengoi]|nr:hypothetical protein C8J57DRAFT_1557458 [Mycena rebaudengoi]